MNAVRKLTADRLRQQLDYIPDTGEFKWRARPSTRVSIGAVAGHLHAASGYVRISVDNTIYEAHRLAWLFVHGVWPGVIDHINGIQSDNRFCNLREVSRAENCQNLGMRSNNTSGYRGVWRQRQKWCAQISVGKQIIFLGSHLTPEAASAAYQEARASLYKAQPIAREFLPASQAPGAGGEGA